jgi:hypothetical protein
MKSSLFVYMCLSAALQLPTSATAFGAIAVGDANPKASDASTEQHFVVSGQATRDAASEAALNLCRAKGLHFCNISVWFDGCAAYAKSETESGSAWAATEDEAKRIALASCGQGCKVLVSQCDSAK